MLTCMTATKLLSQLQDGKLHLSQQLVLRWHLLCCSDCKSFLIQLHTLRSISRLLAMREDNSCINPMNENIISCNTVTLYTDRASTTVRFSEADDERVTLHQ